MLTASCCNLYNGSDIRKWLHMCPTSKGNCHKHITFTRKKFQSESNGFIKK